MNKVTKPTNYKRGDIRVFSREEFFCLNDLRMRGEEPFEGPDADTIFRRDVMASLMDVFGITKAAAAGHYNYALKYAQEQHPELVIGLGRPEDKKGGRKTNLERQLRASSSL